MSSMLKLLRTQSSVVTDVFKEDSVKEIVDCCWHRVDDLN